MPLGEYPFSKYYAWVRDRYGFTWQLMLTDPAGEPAPFFIPALMFGGPTTATAFLPPRLIFRFSTATGRYCESMKKTACWKRDRLSSPISFWVVGGSPQWTPGPSMTSPSPPSVSLILSVPDQTLIDHHRAELSAYPEAERFGWCKDRWGVSWQILPDNLGSLLQDEGFRSAFMSMGKFTSTPEPNKTAPQLPSPPRGSGKMFNARLHQDRIRRKRLFPIY